MVFAEKDDYLFVTDVFEIKLDEDYIRVEMRINGSDHVEFHAHVSTRSEEFFRKTAISRKGKWMFIRSYKITTSMGIVFNVNINALYLLHEIMLLNLNAF